MPSGKQLSQMSSNSREESMITDKPESDFLIKATTFKKIAVQKFVEQKTLPKRRVISTLSVSPVKVQEL
jgi:hypothetical protein